MNRITVVDCGASGVTLGAFSASDGKLCCDFLAAQALPVAADENWLGAVIAALPALTEKSGNGGPVVLVLPPHAVLLKHLKTPRVDPAKLDRLVRFEVGQNMPFAIEEVVWDTVVTGEQAQEIDLLLIAAKLEVVEPLCLAARCAGLHVCRVVPAALTTRAVEQLGVPGGAERRLVLSLGTRGTTFWQIDGGRCAVRSLATGGNVSGGTEPGEAWSLRLAQEARRSMLHFQRQNGLEAPVLVRLAGDRERHPDLATLLSGQLSLPVEWFDATPAVRFASGIVPGVAGPAFGDLVGAAAIQLQSAPGSVNLLPPAVRRREGLRRRRPWLIAAAVVAAAAMLPPILYFRHETAVARAELAALKAIVAPLRAREIRNRARLEEIAALTAEAARLRSLDQRRTSWMRFLGDLQERFTGVEDAWLESLQAAAPEGDAPMKLVISGRMLDRANPLAKVSPETVPRVQALLQGIADSPFVMAVEGERFDTSRPGILKFDFILVTNPACPL